MRRRRRQTRKTDSERRPSKLTMRSLDHSQRREVCRRDTSFASVHRRWDSCHGQLVCHLALVQLRGRRLTDVVFWFLPLCCLPSAVQIPTVRLHSMWKRFEHRCDCRSFNMDASLTSAFPAPPLLTFPSGSQFFVRSPRFSFFFTLTEIVTWIRSPSLRRPSSTVSTRSLGGCSRG